MQIRHTEIPSYTLRMAMVKKQSVLVKMQEKVHFTQLVRR